MTTNTYDALRTTTVGTSTPSVTLDLTGITGYTDLVLVSNVRINQSTSSDIYCQPNGVGTANKGFTFLIGNGSTATSGRASNDANIRIGAGTGTSQASGIFATSISHFMNYSNTTTFKTILSRGSDATNAAQAIVGLFPSTNAITSIVIYGNAGVNILAGSTFSLYGIAAEGTTPAPKATGGAIYSDSTHYYHVFGSTGVFTPASTLSCDYLVVAGGGGGGGQQGGGGGAGGLRAFASASLSATNYAVTVGGGGNGGFGSANRGTNGTNSTFNSNSVTGGGGGASNAVAASSGGSGGGGGINSSAAGAGNAGSYSPVEGFAGGNPATVDGGAGGGGAGAVGVSKDSSGNGKNGGTGVSIYNSIDFSTWLTATGLGTLGKLAGGGGGGTSSPYIVGVGGAGGGGTGGNVEQQLPLPYQNGVFASGGGGGGGSQFNGNAYGGNGGSGVVVIRYLKA
jgi:hypothetical protein